MSRKTIEFYGHRKDEKMHISHRDRLLSAFLNAYKEGDRFIGKIEPVRRKRSLPQNSYYRGVVLPILLAEVREQGNEFDSDALHEVNLQRFAPNIDVHNSNGEVFQRPMRTHEMNTSQMSDFTSDVMKWAAEFWSCYIPEPNTQTEAF